MKSKPHRTYRKKHPIRRKRPFFEQESAKSRDAAAPFFAPPTVQPRLTVGKADDPREKAADDAARQVMQRSEAQAIRRQESRKEEELQTKTGIQKQEKGMEEEELQARTIRRRPGSPSAEAPSPLRRQSDGGGAAVSAEMEQQLAAAAGKGDPLPDDIREEMEQSFGVDFRSVRIHTGPDAIRMTTALNALAFTYGRDIFFNRRQYAPYTPAGKELLAHELAHVVQQGA